MNTVINNNLRVYQVVSSLGKQWFCNITELNKVINDNELKAGYFTIYHFWNNKPEKVSKKYMKELFEGSQLKQEFNY